MATCTPPPPNFMTVPSLDLKFFHSGAVRAYIDPKCEKIWENDIKNLMDWGHIRDLEKGKYLSWRKMVLTAAADTFPSSLTTNYKYFNKLVHVIVRRQQKVGLLFPSISSSRHMTFVYKDIWNKTHLINHFPSQSSKRMQTEVISTFSLPRFHTTEQIL